MKFIHLLPCRKHTRHGAPLLPQVGLNLLLLTTKQPPAFLPPRMFSPTALLKLPCLQKLCRTNPADGPSVPSIAGLQNSARTLPWLLADLACSRSGTAMMTPLLIP